MSRRAAFWLALGAVACPAAWGHGPSGGGPDDPEASARQLTFDARLADASHPLDERPLPWIVSGPAVVASPKAATAPAPRQPGAALPPRPAPHAPAGAP